MNALPVWVVFTRPSDMPDAPFVVRPAVGG